MAENSTGQERTEAATARRRRRAREQGDVTRSVEIGSVAVLAGGLVGFAAFGPDMVGAIVEVLRGHFAALSTTEITHANAVPFARRVTTSLAAVLLPWSAVVALVGTGASLAQTGAVFTWRPLVPTLGRLSPGAARRRFSRRRSAMELGKSLLKLAIVGGLVAWTLRVRVETLLPLATTGIGSASMVIVRALFEAAAVGTLGVAAVAILDYAGERWNRENRIKMTRQEAKEDRKQSEGDPLAKGRVRERRAEMIRRGTARDVTNATVVVTHSVHLAVAIAYDAGHSGAPSIVARGERLLAQRILDEARPAGVPIVENPPLARALYREAGTEISPSQYEAIAALLADLYAAGVR